MYIAPLFNRYTRLSDERVRQPILSMARANGIPVTEIWEADASRQSKRVSARQRVHGHRADYATT